MQILIKITLRIACPVQAITSPNGSTVGTKLKRATERGPCAIFFICTFFLSYEITKKFCDLKSFRSTFFRLGTSRIIFRVKEERQLNDYMHYIVGK